MKNILLSIISISLGILTILGSSSAPSIKEQCSSGKASACTSVGYSFSSDYTKAIPAFERACALGDSNGCINLVNLYRDDENIPKNINLAKKYAGIACQLGDKNACTMRTRPKTIAEMNQDKINKEKFLACFMNLDSCKAKCLDKRGPIQGNDIDIALRNMKASMCFEKCRQCK